MLKENGYQESIISKFLIGITNNQSFPSYRYPRGRDQNEYKFTAP